MTAPNHGQLTPDPMDVLPMGVGFSVRYIDGAMENEAPELRDMWAKVRKHLLIAGRSPDFDVTNDDRAIVYMRNAGDHDDPCYVPCAKGDLGSICFVEAHT